MNKSNFNPKEYEILNNARIKIVSKLTQKIDFNNKKILDIGCGTGHFSYALAEKTNNSFIMGIDIVESYVFYASLNNKHKNKLHFQQLDYNELDGKYDVITMFLGLTELLKKQSLNQILTKLSNLLTAEGVIIVCDEFKNDYSENIDKLGINVMQKLGYKYVDTKFLKKEAKKAGLFHIDNFLFKTKSKKTNFNGSKVRIFYETKLSEFDNTKTVDAKNIWDEYKQEIKHEKGIRVNNLIHTFIFQKHALKANKKISSLSFAKPTLIYDINIIKENILYIKDLDFLNVKFNFPVKAFPDFKLLNIFNDYGFGFDVSNENELKLVVNLVSKDKIYYSDPSHTLLNKTSLRINIYNKYIKSHFGSEITKLNKKINYIHLHLAEVKTKKVLNSVIQTIKEIDFTYIKKLNIGGGYEELSYYEIHAFIQSIRKIIPKNVSIIIECGSLWFKNAGYLYAEISHIEKLRNINYVFLNASKECHAKWSNPEIINFFHLVGKDVKHYVFCGSSCNEKDIFCTFTGKTIFLVNESILLKNIEPYSFSWNSSFNGIEKAKVYFYE